MSNAFEKAAEDVTKLSQRPNRDDLSALYGLYKQATVGDVNIDRPGLLDFQGRMKWDAWNAKKGVSKDDAKAAYICLVQELKEKDEKK